MGNLETSQAWLIIVVVIAFVVKVIQANIKIGRANKGKNKEVK